MKTRIKILIAGAVIVVTILALSWKGFFASIIRDIRLQGSEVLYTVVNTKGVKENDHVSSDPDFIPNYLYQSMGYKEDGTNIAIEFFGMDGKTFPMGTYLKIHYDDEKGVLSWEMIDVKEVPENIVKLIQKEIQ